MAVYPRKQTVVIFILCAFAVGATAHIVRPQHSSGEPRQQKETAAVAAAEVAFPENTDWQKQFASYDAPPAAARATQKASSLAENEQLNATDKLGRDFLTSYASLHQAGLTKDSGSVGSAIDQVISNGAANIPTPKEYSRKDIVIVPANPASLAGYADIIEAAFQHYGAQPDEADIAVRAYESGDMSGLASIEPISRAYAEVIARLLAPPVPSDLADTHVVLLNGLSALKFSADSFRHMDADPLQGLAAVRFDALGAQATNAAFADIRARLSARSASTH